MTVCTAAICENGIIFGAADRMITSGDIQFESLSTKIYPLTNSIAVMTAGDSAFHAEILSFIHKEVTSRITKDQATWIKVKDIAELYIYYRNVIKKRRAENRILVPLGLTIDSFYLRQKEMANDFIMSITKELLHFEVPDIAAIVTGIDAEGSHIFVTINDNISCQNNVGFASIGIGSRHAESQFMLAGHGKASPMPETLLLTYASKRRAEISPGVGQKTDMFLMGPAPGSFTPLNSEVMNKLETAYKKMRKRESDSESKAKNEVKSYVAKVMEGSKKSKPQKTSKISNGSSTKTSIDNELPPEPTSK